MAVAGQQTGLPTPSSKEKSPVIAVATTNVKDFAGLEFQRVWNPSESD
jgi:hypothetical protein